jgi:hypothetical protein
MMSQATFPASCKGLTTRAGPGSRGGTDARGGTDLRGGTVAGTVGQFAGRVALGVARSVLAGLAGAAAAAALGVARSVLAGLAGAAALGVARSVLAGAAVAGALGAAAGAVGAGALGRTAGALDGVTRGLSQAPDRFAESTILPWRGAIMTASSSPAAVKAASQPSQDARGRRGGVSQWLR